MPKVKILVADDSATVSAVLIDVLDRAGFDVLHAAEGLSAVDMAKKERPQLALVDVVLPLLDGLGVCRAIRADPELGGMKVILMSAQSDQRNQANATAAGANAFISKPIDKEMLVLAVGEVLRS